MATPDAPTLHAPELMSNLAALLAVVEAGGFSAASRRVHIDKTVLSRRVKRLEQALGVRLLNRTTRSVQLTHAGRRLVEQSGAPLEQIAHALRHASERETVAGTLRVTTLPGLAETLWGPLLVEIAERHPKLLIDLRAEARMQNLVAEGLDLAFRTGNLPDSSAVARRLATWRYVMVASPAWIERHPDVTHPDQLRTDWLLFSGLSQSDPWVFERGSERVALTVEPRLFSDNERVLVSAAINGVGVLPATPTNVMQPMARGELVRILPSWRMIHTHGIYAVTPHRTLQPAGVQAVIQAASARLKVLEHQWAALTD